MALSYMARQICLPETVARHKYISTYFRVFSGNYLVILDIVIKCVYVTNTVLQIYALNIFLGTSYNEYYGFKVAKSLMYGKNLLRSDTFPRVTMCDIKVRVLGNVHRRTMQCALPLNLYIEIIFIFIWFWFVFVACVSSLNVLVCIMRAVNPADGRSYVKKKLIAMGEY